ATLFRNIALIAMAALLVALPQQTVSLSATAWFAELTTGERTLFLIGLIAVLLLAVGIGLLVRLLRQNKRLLAALAESQLAFVDDGDEPVVRNDLSLPGRGLPVGAPAPAFQLADLAGNEMTLETLLGESYGLALFFVSPSCSLCVAMLADIARWQRQYGEFL